MTFAALDARRATGAVEQLQLHLAPVAGTLRWHDASGTTRAGRLSGLAMCLHPKTSS